MWAQSTGPGSDPAGVLEPIAAGARRLGCLLDVGLHPRQRLPSLLCVEYAGLPHRVHQYPNLPRPLDRLDGVHALIVLASR